MRYWADGRPLVSGNRVAMTSFPESFHGQMEYIINDIWMWPRWLWWEKSRKHSNQTSSSDYSNLLPDVGAPNIIQPSP